MFLSYKMSHMHLHYFPGKPSPSAGGLKKVVVARQTVNPPVVVSSNKMAEVKQEPKTLVKLENVQVIRIYIVSPPKKK